MESKAKQYERQAQEADEKADTVQIRRPKGLARRRCTLALHGGVGEVQRLVTRSE